MLISGLTKENDMKYPTIALTLVALAATQGPTAMAQDASARARDIFAKADTNQGSVANSDTVSKIGLMYCQGQLR